MDAQYWNDSYNKILINHGSHRIDRAYAYNYEY